MTAEKLVLSRARQKTQDFPPSLPVPGIPGGDEENVGIHVANGNGDRFHLCVFVPVQFKDLYLSLRSLSVHKETQETKEETE